MKQSTTLAYINLYAVLRNIQDLTRLDSEASSLIQGANEVITFKVASVGSASLVMRDGKCQMTRKKVKSTIVLYFKSPEHFNAMVDGKANPIPLKGFTKIKFLTGAFTRLTDRLAYFLRPEPGLLKDPAFKRIHTELSLYTAAFALGEIANHDYIGQKLMKAMPEGVVAMEVMDGPAVSIQSKDGKLKVLKKKAEKPRARMAFSDMDAAFGLLSGQVDSYTCIASEKLLLSGFIPMLDLLDKLLFQVSAYLK